MKNITQYYLLFVLLIATSVFGQDQAPTSPGVSSLMRFEDHPVNYYTGLPSISIPLYTMPTRSKDIAINIGLSYHASSVSDTHKEIGDCGRGWSLSTGGGAISKVGVARPYRTDSKGQYQFNFREFSGKFDLDFSSSGANIQIKESNGKRIKFAFEYHTFVDYDTITNYVVDKIMVFDDKGYKYEFSIFDTYNYSKSHHGAPGVQIPPSIFNIRQAFHLTSIYDPNNNELASFQFSSYNEGSSLYHIISQVNIAGFSAIRYTNSLGSNPDYNSNYRFTEIRIGPLHNPLKKFTFHYDSDAVKQKLTKVKEINSQEGISGEYKLSYKNNVIVGNNDIIDTDFHGYNNITNVWCFYNDTPGNPSRNGYSRIADEYAMVGALEKITLPTGGVILYDYELSTYSYLNNKPIDLVTNGETYEQFIDPLFFYKLKYNDPIIPINLGQLAHNLKNYNITSIPVLNSNFSSSDTASFSSTGDTYYFKFDADQYTIEGGQIGGGNILAYPTFKLSGPGFTKEFKVNGDYEDNEFGNGQNFCMGTNLDLNSDNFTIKKLSSFPSVGSVRIYKRTQVPQDQLKKWWNGGGIRIKGIQHFESEEKVSAYINDPDNPINKPERKISFNYNFFNEQNRSSGSISAFATQRVFRLGYKNVTVYDSQYRGRVEYTYSSPIDWELPYQDSNHEEVLDGQLLNKRIFNSGGDVEQETIFDYELAEESEINYIDFAFSYKYGWLGPRRVTNIMNYPQGTIKTVDDYLYNSLFKLSSHKKTTEPATDVLLTKYFYHTPTVATNNRIAPGRVETYRNNKLLSTSETNYNNSWSDSQNTVINTSYLPQSVENAKGYGVAESKVKFNRYDEYGHVLEYEQENGIKICYIWGYDNTQIIAKLENISYNDIPANLITTSQNTLDEATLLQALAALRNSPAVSGALVTTYTHFPLIGVSTVTDPRGYKLSYEYDENNRLKLVKDAQGNILSENEYHIKSQN